MNMTHRNNNKVDTLLKELEIALQREENVMPLMIEAVKAYASIGEIVQTIEKIYGRFRPETGV